MINPALASTATVMSVGAGTIGVLIFRDEITAIVSNVMLKVKKQKDEYPGRHRLGPDTRFVAVHRVTP